MARTVSDERRNARWAVLALAALAAACYGWGLSRGGTHYYYSAAVRAMSENWGNFFFGAFDPQGAITVDKLPGALWAQALSVRLFGFHTWVLLLPGVLAAIATVPLLFGAVRRWAGMRAGVFAGVAFVLTPAVFAVVRVNLAEPVLVLCLVAAAYALTRALQGRSRWLPACAALVGVAFQVKMMQAWLVLPAFCVAYLIGAPVAIAPRWWRAGWLALGSIVPDSGSSGQLRGEQPQALLEKLGQIHACQAILDLGEVRIFAVPDRLAQAVDLSGQFRARLACRLFLEDVTRREVKEQVRCLGRRGGIEPSLP